MSSIGPALPPGWTNQNSDSDSDDVTGSEPSNHSTDCGQGSVIGPALPPMIKDSDESSSSIGPALPPVHQSESSSAAIGPTIGPAVPDLNQSESSKAAIGPALPPNYHKPIAGPALPPDLEADQSESDDDDDVIGPSLDLLSAPSTSVSEEFERRVAKMAEKIDSKNKPKVLKRESWMTELPSKELGAQLGFGNRQFRSNPGVEITEEDRESWTTVGGQPKNQSRKRPADSQSFPEEIAKDTETKRKVEQFNKSERAESLMDLHSKELKKKKKKEEKERGDTKPERVPFDRERDLNTKRFDEAQRKAILKKAAKLDSRFSHGGKQYL